MIFTPQLQKKTPAPAVVMIDLGQLGTIRGITGSNLFGEAAAAFWTHPTGKHSQSLNSKQTSFTQK